MGRSHLVAVERAKEVFGDGISKIDYEGRNSKDYNRGIIIIVPDTNIKTLKNTLLHTLQHNHELEFVLHLDEKDKKLEKCIKQYNDNNAKNGINTSIYQAEVYLEQNEKFVTIVKRVSNMVTLNLATTQMQAR